MKQRVPLSATEEAFVAMVLEEHQALVRNADAKRDQRMSVLLAEKQIPNGTGVKVNRLPDDTQAHLEYDDGKAHGEDAA